MMKAGTVYEKQIKAMGHSLKIDVTSLLKPTAFLLFGAVCSCFDSIKGISPFSFAAVASVDTQYCFITFTGACIGYLAAGDFSLTLRYFCALALIMAIRILYSKKPRSLNENILCCALAPALSLAAGAAYMALTQFSFESSVRLVCEAVTAGGACYFMRRSFGVPAFKIGIGHLHKQDLAFVCISACITLLCACGINIGFVRPAHMLAFFIILTAAHYKGCAGGSLAGICIGGFLCITPDFSHLFAAMAVGGFLAGLFSGLGQFGCAVAFTAACSIITLFEQGSKESLCTLLEAACVCAAFAAMPVSPLIKLENYLDKSGLTNSPSIDREAAYSLKKAADTIGEISDIVLKVSESMNDIANPQMSKIYARIQQSVCRACENKSDCWGKNFDETAKEITDISQGKNCSESTCIKTEELTRAIKRDRKEYAAFFDTKLELDEVRAVVSDQFGSMSGLMDDIADRMIFARTYDYSKAVTIKQALRQQDIQLENATYSVGRNGRARVEISIYGDSCEIDHKQIRSTICDAVMTEFDSPEIGVADLLVTLTFFQSHLYNINTGSSFHCANDGCICGDSIECFEDFDENTVAIISDGMGTGARAAIDGTMASTLMKKLVMSGFSYDNALNLVNSALLVKSSDESLATVDAVKINPYTGLASFYKAGAAASYIRSKGEVTCISRASLPAGILRNISFACEDRMTENTDIILMVSDGVNGCEWVMEELLTWNGTDMSSLASHIADLAKLKSDVQQRDDISAVAILITENS